MCIKEKDYKMRILPITNNQQNTNSVKNPNFGVIFKLENNSNELFALAEKLLESKIYFLSDVLDKSPSDLDIRNATKSMGEYLAPEHKKLLKSEHPTTVLEQSDVKKLLSSFNNFGISLDNTPGEMIRRLTLALTDIPTLTKEKLDAALAKVTKPRENLTSLEARTRKKLGI